MENNVVLITNDELIADFIDPKLALLRNLDKISIFNYQKAVAGTKKINPYTIIVHAEAQENTLELIRKIKSTKQIADTPLILLLDNYDKDFIISAYDEKISDYMLLKADDAEFLMRVIWSLKKNTIEQQNKQYFDLLENLKVINPQSGLYSNQYCDNVFELEFKKLRKESKNSVFMLISLDETSKTQITTKEFAKVIKNSIRTADIIAHAQSNRFYILLEKTELKGALAVFEKIKSALAKFGLKIHAGLSLVEIEDYNKTKQNVESALLDAMNAKTDFMVTTQIEEQISDNWLNQIQSGGKNFKLFKHKFNKKVEKVVIPVFYQIQKTYEEKLFKTKVEQACQADLSWFSLESESKKSILKITYPGFSRVNIELEHSGLDSPENTQIVLDLSQLNEERLIEILEKFIEEFKSQA